MTFAKFLLQAASYNLDNLKAVSDSDASKEKKVEEKEEKEEEGSTCNNNNNNKELVTNGSHPEEGEVEAKSNSGGTTSKGRAYLEKVNERKRTWDYFEINHPKAISDKKLEQLKEKYTRRKTEASLLLEKKKEEREVDLQRYRGGILMFTFEMASNVSRWGRVSGKVRVRRRE